MESSSNNFFRFRTELIEFIGHKHLKMSKFVHKTSNVLGLGTGPADWLLSEADTVRIWVAFEKRVRAVKLMRQTRSN